MKYVLTISLILLVGALQPSALAHTMNTAKSQSKSTPALRERTFKKLSEAQKQIEEEKFQEAENALNALLNTRLNAYEKAQTLNIKAYLYHVSNRVPAAIKSYQQILELGDLPSAFQQTILYTLAQLHITTDNYKEALHLLEHWFELTETPTATAYGLLAQLQYQEKHYGQAEASINTAIQMHQQEGKIPLEAWWQVKLAIHYEKKHYAAMIEVLTQLTTWYSRPQYWTQLASLYGQQNQTTKQLYTLDAAYIKGDLTQEHHLLQLAHLLQANGAPYRAGKILQKGMADGIIEKNRKNWQSLASAWFQAKEFENTIQALEQTANLSSDAQPFLQLAYLLSEQNRYIEALKIADNALQRQPSQKDAIKIYTLIGTIEFYQKNFTAANRAFTEALNIARLEEADLSTLQSWISHNKLEQQRYQLVKEYL